MQNANSQIMLEDQLLAVTGTAATMAFSNATECLGNKVTAAITILATTATVTMHLEGSFEGNVWYSLASSAALVSPGYTEIAATNVRHAFIRLRTVASVSGNALFNASVAFADL
jgi:hypothetical protein